MPSSQGKDKGQAGREGKRDKGIFGEGRHEEQGLAQSEFLYWQPIYDMLESKNPDSPQITVSDGNASVALSNFGNVRAADNYKFDPQNGSITKVTPYSDSDKANKVRGWISSIHMGSWGGIFTKILWMLAALLGASLPLTGYYIWISRLSKKKK